MKQVLSDLLGKRLILVTGKGGTGKTTFASALALLGAARGLDTLLCEVDNQRPALTSIFGLEPTWEPCEVADGLHVCNLTWDDALVAFLRRTVPAPRVLGLILQNQAVQRFLDFTPGSQEMVVLSAIADRTDDYDLVVVDLPASGHARALLDIPRSALGLFRTGPVRKRASELEALVRSGRSQLVLVALPEEMVVNETLETRQHLQDVGDAVVFLNRATAPTLRQDEARVLQQLEGAALEGLAGELVCAGAWEASLEAGAAEALARLPEALVVPPMEPLSSEEDVVTEVAVHLGRQVGVSRRDVEGLW